MSGVGLKSLFSKTSVPKSEVRNYPEKKIKVKELVQGSGVVHSKSAHMHRSKVGIFKAQFIYITRSMGLRSCAAVVHIRITKAMWLKLITQNLTYSLSSARREGKLLLDWFCSHCSAE